ncbi:putative oxidoreductase [Stigmatella aurantiaca]|uniref:Putative oxidoreductase n=1 Tax=Stigmatella aurantiaca TaxID=41 RepID=A0A1H7SMA6_STIAU|nr:DoxX family protein [Stigmatella aurantiaca]SEL73653.1 putative oxidoreductase [Stigmatella aurantiaca]
MNNVNSKWVSLVGRVLLGSLFVISGLGKLGNWEQTAAHMASQGLPLANLLLAGAAAAELAGGLSLLLGYRTPWGALMLAAFLVPVSLTMHAFWAHTGEARQMHLIHFMKNLSLIGGLLAQAVAGPGALSLDARRATLHSGTASRVPQHA